MASSVWKGHLTFGLVSVPVKLVRAARPEKISFHQLHKTSGTRVRQKLVAEVMEPPEVEEPAVPAPRSRPAPISISREPEPQPVPQMETREVTRDELIKGFEYEKDRYATFTKEELAAIQPKTSREMQILEFVKLSDVDPIYFETSYYASPDAGGERAYGILFESLRQSGLVGVAQIAMHNKEHIVLVRAGRRGLILHTMFYETEIRRLDEYRTDTVANSKELELALLLIKHLEAPFAPEKYHDTYREKLQAMIDAKVGSEEVVESRPAVAPQVVDILDALRKSLESMSPKKPPVSEEQPAEAPKTRRRPKAKGA